MRIYIPTYQRVGTQLTFNALPRRWKAQTTFVLNAWDHKCMKHWIEDNGADAWIVPLEIDTIAAKRMFIIEEAKEDKIVMMDDDLRFSHRVDGKLVKADPDNIGFYLTCLEDKLDDYVHAGFSARQGNNRLPDGWKSPHRMMYVLGYRPAVLRENCELGRIETREDFDYTLQLLRLGFPNAVTCDICVDQKYNNKGGCSSQRTVEASNADAEKLAALHPGYVKFVTKDYLASVPRKEVTVQWKKALTDART